MTGAGWIVLGACLVAPGKADPSPSGNAVSVVFVKAPDNHAPAITHATLQEKLRNEEQVRFRTWGLIAAGAIGVVGYGYNKWWQDGFNKKYRSVDEGWFGQNTGDGGADKLGHAYANYVGTRLMARVFEWVGNEPAPALKLAAWSTLATFATAEILDGFTSRWRFSKEDLIMNAVGGGLGVLMEKNLELDRLIDFRLLYRPPEDTSRGRDFDPFGDYSGQTYLLVAKASGVPALREHKMLRYFELAVGYGTRGYETGPEFPGDRARNVYFGISLNLSEVLGRTVFRNSPQSSYARRGANGFLEVVQVPGTVALAKRGL